MSTYRPMERARHSDERIQQVSPIARAVWDYVCCNLQDHPSGLYRLSVASACEDTGWEPEQFEEALNELETQDLLVRDQRVRLIWVRNMLRKSYPGTKLAKNQMRGITRHLESMPKTDLVGSLVSYYADRYGVTIPCSTLDQPLGKASARVLKDPPIGTVRFGLGSDRFGSDRFGPDEEMPAAASATLAQISDALITGVYTPPKGLERLRTVRGHLEALALHLTQDGSRSPQDISAEVLATTEAVARLIDSGDIDRDRWGSGGFLTAKSYEWARSQISGGKKKARRAMVASDDEYPPTDEDIKL